MKLKKHTKEETFKMRSPNGTIHEVPNSHRKNIEKIMKNGGKVEAYLKKLEDGGMPTQQQGGQEQQMQQIMQMVAQALQQGQKPEQIMQMLVQQGVPQQMAQQVIQQVMQQLQVGQQQGPQEEQQEPQQEAPQQEQQEGMDTGNQQAPMMRFGGLPIAEWGTNTLGVNGMSKPKLYTPKTDALNFNSQDVTGSTPNPDVNSHPGFDDSMNALPTDANGFKNNPNQLPSNQILNKQPGQYNPTAPQLGGNTPLTGADPTNTKSPYAFTGKYMNGPIQDLNAAHNDLVDSQYYAKMAVDPNTSASDATRFGKLAKYDRFTSGAHSVRFGIDAVRYGFDKFSGALADSREQRDAREHQRLQASVDGEITKKDNGDRSQLGNGTYAGYSKFGGKLPLFEHGGMHTEGSDFGSEDPNVMTERGETISDPTKGPVGPDGQPTGLVVHDRTGDEHSDPSGGNPLKLGSNSVVHSKSLGISIGAFVEYAQQFPNAEFIIKTVTEKYKDPNKEVTYADLAKLFDTKALVKEVTMIAKKLDKEEAKVGNSNNTKVANKTAELNTKTLKLKEQATKEEMAQNAQATGADGPIYNLAEGLKGSGAYGKQLQKETLEPSQAPTTKFGGKMKNGGIISPNFKKIKQAKYGYNTEAPGIPTMGYTGKIVSTSKDNFNDYAQGEDGKWYYYNGSTLGAEVPVGSGPNKSQLTPQIQGSQTAPVITPQVTNTPLLNSVVANQTQPLEFPTGNDLTGAVTNFKGLQWLGTDVPRADQLRAGLPKGFNKSPWAGKSYEGLRSLQASGFDPSKYNHTWNNITAEDIQDHLLNKDKAQGYNVIKGLFKHYKDTNQGELGGLKNKEWEELTDTDKEKFFKDNMYGIRTYAAQALLGDTPQVDPVTGQVSEPAKQDAKVQQFAANVKAGPLKNKRIFQEGLNPAQIAGPLTDLLARKQAVPYIEDKGAADAMAMNTRQRFTDIQPQLNRITRDLQARTRNSQDNVTGAQYAANAYEAANQVYGQKYNADNQIENQYNQQQLQLRQQAGTNKAKAQEELATRTATRDWKDYAMRRNALGEIGNKYEQNVAENRSAALYQDMFDQYGLNPNFTTGLTNGKQLSINPLYNNPLAQSKTTEEQRKAAYKLLYGSDPDKGLLSNAPDSPNQKFGGKVKGKKTLPKKMIKSKRVK